MASAVERRLLALDALRRPASVMLFCSFGSEIPTRGMAETLARDGHRVLMPFMEGDEIHAAEFRPQELVPSPYGPMEPSGRHKVPVQQVDVVVVPGLAFDARGYRLGYGGGHYDRFLAHPRLTALIVGIGFHFQKVDRVPHDSMDRPVDLLVTDVETISCRPVRRL